MEPDQEMVHPIKVIAGGQRELVRLPTSDVHHQREIHQIETCAHLISEIVKQLLQLQEQHLSYLYATAQLVPSFL